MAIIAQKEDHVNPVKLPYLGYESYPPIFCKQKRNLLWQHNLLSLPVRSDQLSEPRYIPHLILHTVGVRYVPVPSALVLLGPFLPCAFRRSFPPLVIPSPNTHVVRALQDLPRSKAELVLENALLRHQRYFAKAV